MRIAICGTHGVGKTTLAREISKRLGLDMIDEVARVVIREAGYDNTAEYIKKASPIQKERVQKEIYVMQEKMEMTRKRDGFISDRSVFDAVAYAKAYGVDEKTVNRLLGRAIGHALITYDLVVYVPPFWPPENDGFRDTDIELWGKVNADIVRYINAFEMLGGRVLRTKMTNLELRIHEVMDTVRNLEARHEAL